MQADPNAAVKDRPPLKRCCLATMWSTRKGGVRGPGGLGGGRGERGREGGGVRQVEYSSSDGGEGVGERAICIYPRGRSILTLFLHMLSYSTRSTRSTRSRRIKIQDTTLSMRTSVLWGTSSPR